MNKIPEKNIPFYSVKSLAKKLNVSEKTVRRWIERKELTAHKLGTQWRISSDDLEIFLKLRRN